MSFSCYVTLYSEANREVFINRADDEKETLLKAQMIFNPNSDIFYYSGL